MASVVLSDGDLAFVDDSDLLLVAPYSWWKHNAGYAMARVAGKRLLMHRLILQSVDRIDHEDGNKLNNRRSNLRPATRSQNAANRGKQANNRSGFKGVFPLGSGLFRATIRVNGRTHNLGHYPTARQAAVAYNNAAMRHFGPYARLNEVANAES